MSDEDRQRPPLSFLITHYSSLITSCWETRMGTYKVIVVGMGKRGKHHAAAFRNNPRFELAGICSRDPERLEKAAAELGSPPRLGDPPAMRVPGGAVASGGAGAVRTSTDPLALAK